MAVKRTKSSHICPHCAVKTPMDVLGSIYKAINEDRNFEAVPEIDEYDCFDVLSCPNCSQVHILRYYWCDLMDEDDDIDYEILYPSFEQSLTGVPNHIVTALKSANKVKHQDPGAYAMLVRRTLELICHNQGANGQALNQMLNDLIERGIIPNNLSQIAHSIRLVGNEGAHGALDAIEKKHVDVLSKLLETVTEYCYKAPYLASEAERSFSNLKSLKKKKKN